MLLVGERVDGGQPAELGKLLHVRLIERPYHRAMHHATEDARGVLHGFATAELRIRAAEKHHVPAEFADADLEAYARACGRLIKDQCPGLALEDLRGGCAVLAQSHTELHDGGDFLRSERFDGKEILHDNAPRVSRMMRRPSLTSDSVVFIGGSHRTTFGPAATV